MNSVAVEVANAVGGRDRKLVSVGSCVSGNMGVLIGIDVDNVVGGNVPAIIGKRVVDDAGSEEESRLGQVAVSVEELVGG